MIRWIGQRSCCLLLLLILALSGCRTAQIPEPTKNPVPPNMTLEEVRRLITVSLGVAPQSQWDNPTTTSQKVLKEIFTTFRARSSWRIEAIEPQAIRAATFHRAKFYVATKIHFTKTEWWVEIVDGKNIKYDGERIHENALIWVTQLESKIHRAFGTYQTMIELEHNKTSQ